MIKFDDLLEESMTEFNGGKGTIKAKKFTDENGKIMRATLEKGVSIGSHMHTTSSEIIYIISGVAKCMIDGKEEIVKQGECHYCPKGSTHSVINENDENLVMLCVVPNQ